MDEKKKSMSQWNGQTKFQEGDHLLTIAIRNAYQTVIYKKTNKMKTDEKFDRYEYGITDVISSTVV